VILVTGGTGYIGSHTVVELMASGKDVFIVDNLCNSKASVLDRIERIAGRRPGFAQLDVRDRDALRRLLSAHRIDAVIHFAGLKAVGESVARPLAYFDNNVSGSVALFECMLEAGVKTIVFSSSATVYGASGLICHQRAARSFHLAGVQLPVCGRCASLYFSGALGAVLGWTASKRPRTVSWTRRLLLWAALPTALSVVLEFSGLLDPLNVGRALCALPLGAAAGWIFVQSLRSEERGAVTVG